MKNLFSALILVLFHAASIKAQSHYCFLRGDSLYLATCTTGICNCEGLHPIFKVPSNQNPLVIPHLGTNPQFGTLRFLKSTQEVYDHLHKRYDNNQGGDAAELDKLWKAMGYTGFKDPTFKVAQLTMTYYDGGITGMLGAGGHTYHFSTIAPGQDIKLKAYIVEAKGNNCAISIMETCGNAFFIGCEVNCTYQSCSVVMPKVQKSKPYQYTVYRNDSCFVRICNDDPTQFRNTHPIYNIPTDKKPKKLAALGSSPQFGTLKHMSTTQEVYNYLNKVYEEDRNGNAKELDSLWRGMGYLGFEDPRFTVNQMLIMHFDGGITGMLGGGGHHYEYTTIAEDQAIDLKAYQIKALSNCDLNIMETCGNAFFPGCPIDECETFYIGCFGK